MRRILNNTAQNVRRICGNTTQNQEEGDQRATYGDALLTLLAYRECLPIVQTASGQSEHPFSLSWSHYVFVLGIKKADERSFYEIKSTHQNWSLRELRHQFQSGLYERVDWAFTAGGVGVGCIAALFAA